MQRFNVFDEISRSSTNKVDRINNDFAIFDHVPDVDFVNYPMRIDVAIFAICIRGTMQVDLNLQQYSIQPQNMVLLMPDQIVQLHKVSDDFKGIFIVINESFIDELSISLKNVSNIIIYILQHPLTSISETEMNNILEFITFIRKKIHETKVPFKNELNKNLFTASLYEVLTIIYHNELINQTQINTRQEQIFQQFITLLSKYKAHERKISFYANKLCISSKYLTAVVKELSGKTSSQWIEDFVILEAKSLLKTTNLSIQEIADTLNFANQSFFGKYFKKNTNLSPKAYRNS